MNSTSPSAAYWDARYQAGATSGAGSYGRLAAYKAAVINGLIDANGILRVTDFGCGDGNLLSLLHLPAYTGLDVSDTVIARCAARFPHHAFLSMSRAAELHPADMCLSIDVIFHLVEDDVFSTYMDALFARASRLVLIYTSNVNQAWPAPHVRHRRFSDHVAAKFPDWRLRAHMPNPYPFDPSQPNETSFADFFLYSRDAAECILRLPATQI